MDWNFEVFKVRISRKYISWLAKNLDIRGNQISRFGKKIAKPRNFLPAKISDNKVYSNKTYFWAPYIPCNHDLFTIFRSSHRRCSIKKGVLENFANFIRKHLCKGLFFNKSGGLRPTLLKSEFPLNFATFFRTPFWQNTSRDCFGIFQNIHIKNNFRSSRPELFCKRGVHRNFTKFTGKPLCLRPATLLKKRLWHRGFSVNFVIFLRTPFL